MTKIYYTIAVFLFGAILFNSCKQEQPIKPVVEKKATIHVPDFNADSAYQYVKNQTDFGPRIPGSPAHEACANYFVAYFNQLGFKVYNQEFKARAFDGKILNGRNIVAAINPENQNRILLCSHWDSRPFADQDKDPKNHYTPIDGANDGASGVGVLMEVARQLQFQNPTIGIDIVLFDLEDYGQHAEIKSNAASEETWGLGSQYWSKNPHLPGYDARYGILLDMIGAKGAVFYREYFSNLYAPSIINKVWKAAANIGYSDYFKNEEGGTVLDDHVFVNRFATIPTIDIIHYDTELGGIFFPHWHTVEDNLDKIDPFSLKIVGQTLLEVIYKEQ